MVSGIWLLDIGCWVLNILNELLFQQAFRCNIQSSTLNKQHSSFGVRMIYRLRNLVIGYWLLGVEYSQRVILATNIPVNNKAVARPSIKITLLLIGFISGSV
jgi:hypothetical protein